MKDLNRRVTCSRSLLVDLLLPIYTASLHFNELCTIISKLVQEIGEKMNAVDRASLQIDPRRTDVEILFADHETLKQFRTTIEAKRNTDFTSNEAESMKFKMCTLLHVLLLNLDGLKVTFSQQGCLEKVVPSQTARPRRNQFLKLLDYLFVSGTSGENEVSQTDVGSL